MRRDYATNKIICTGVAIRFQRTVMRFLRASIWQNQTGVSALEFSLFAPIVIFGFLSVADLAFLAQQYTAINHVLRVGADEAMLDLSPDPKASRVINSMTLIATEDFAVGSTASVNGKPPLTFIASRNCACPNGVPAPNGCLSICTSPTGTTHPLAFYDIVAESKSLNVFLPQVTLRPRLQVQVR